MEKVVFISSGNGRKKRKKKAQFFSWAFKEHEPRLLVIGDQKLCFKLTCVLLTTAVHREL